MKNSILIVSVFLVFKLSSQTITFTSIPKAKDLMITQGIDSISVADLKLGKIGANNIWDFSGVKKNDLDPIKLQYELPSQPIKNAFPTCNLITFDLALPTEIACFESTTQGLVQLGSANAVDVNPLPKKLLLIPLNLSLNGAAIKDTQEVVRYDSLGNIMDTIHLLMTYKADAVGTLKTPIGSFNALRLSIYLITQESFDIGVGSPVNIYRQQYDWFVPDMKGIVFDYSETGIFSSVFGLQIAGEKNASYLTKSGVSTNNIEVNSITKLYPNPAQESITITTNLEKNESVSIEITDILGQTVLSKSLFLTQGIQNTPLEIDHLQNGGYFLTIKNNDHKMIGNNTFLIHK